MQEQRNKISINDKIVNFVSNNIVWVFLGFTLIVIIIPNLFARLSIFPFIKSNGNGLTPNEIGDAIGGMTAPIIGLFSAFLVYIAFREQIKANEELKEFNKRQVGFNELSEISLLEKNLEEDFDNLNFTFFDKDISKEQYFYKGRQAINQINNFLLNYKSHNHDYITDFIKSKTILEPNFIMFISKAAIFYINIFFLLEAFDESNMRPSVKKFLFNMIQVKYRISIINLEYLIENYENESYPKLEVQIKMLFKQIQKTNEKFDFIKMNMK
jgi:hypothetical protein